MSVLVVKEIKFVQRVGVLHTLCCSAAFKWLQQLITVMPGTDSRRWLAAGTTVRAGHPVAYAVS